MFLSRLGLPGESSSTYALQFVQGLDEGVVKSKLVGKGLLTKRMLKDVIEEGKTLAAERDANHIVI